MKALLKYTIQAIFVSGFLQPLSCNAEGTDKIGGFYEEIKEAPPWGRIASDPEGGQKAKRLMRVAESISRDLSPELARELVQQYVAWIEWELKKKQENRPPQFDSTDELSKLFILNRVYFAVPEWDSIEAADFRGAWAPLAPRQGNRINMLFPINLNPKGSLELAVDGYSYYGATYQALKEFDYFSHRYAERYKKRIAE